MAKTVDSFSTIEDLRLKHNEVALDVGDISGLNTTRRSNLTEAVNSINEREFFFQEFVYTNTTTNQVTITGADAQGNTLRFRKDRIQVFVRGEHLFEGLDYEALNPNSDGSLSTISFNVSGSPYNSGGSKAVQANDRIVIYAFTGSFLGVALQSTGSTFWILDDSNAIFNNNSDGVILNGDNTTLTTDIETGFTLQLAGRTFAEDDIIATAAGKKFQAPIISDGTASLSSGSLTSAVNGTFSGTVQAEQLTSTDDADISGNVTIGGQTITNDIRSSSGNIEVLSNTAKTVFKGGNSTEGMIQLNCQFNSHGQTIKPQPHSANVTNTLTLPAGGNQEIVGADATQTLTNKTLTSPTITGNGSISGVFTGDITGDVKATNGTTVLDNGTNGANAVFTGNVTGDITGDVKASNGTVVLDNGSGSNNDANFLGNAHSATKLESSRNISGVAFDGTGNIELDTSHIDENGRLYFTNARADARIGSANLGDLNNVATSVNSLGGSDSGKILAWDGTQWEEVVKDTTDEIVEGTNNLFYTDERAQDAAAAMITNATHSNITVTYNDSANTLAFSAAAQYGDDDVDSILTAGLGLTKTDTGSGASRDLKFDVNTSNGIKIDGDDVELDYEVISSSSLGGSAPNGTGDPIGHLYFVI